MIAGGVSLLGFAAMSATRIAAAFVTLLVAVAPGCGSHEPGGMSGPSINNRITPKPASSPVVSTEILTREPRANRTKVKHILIGWKDLEANYGGRLNPRAAARTKRDAEDQIRSLQKQLEGGADFDVLMQAHSEDSGLAANPDGYEVTPDASLVLDFRRLGLRLEIGETGVVETDFGFHLIKRIE